uniref:Uncharacterized protein n=1 Tax=Otolemur garnettii TaxID=30611 RepID=H0XM08_OTOGA
EMASAESDEALRPVVGEAPHLTLPADLQTLPLNQPTLSPESKLEWNNDIPEVNHLNSEHWRNSISEKRMGREEINHRDTDFSGNGMTELVPEPSPRLQAISRRQKELPWDGGLGEDIFEDQLYLPVHSDRTSAHQTVTESTVELPINNSTVEGRPINGEDHEGSVQHPEGSASSPLSSD